MDITFINFAANRADTFSVDFDRRVAANKSFTTAISNSIIASIIIGLKRIWVSACIDYFLGTAFSCTNHFEAVAHSCPKSGISLFHYCKSLTD